MILFAFPDFEGMAAGLGASAGRFHARRFDNGELCVEVETPVAGEDCAILGSITPPDANLFSTLLLAHTLRKEGARRITGVLPYLAYSRQDKNKSGQSLAAAWTGELARASGFDRVITVDAHSSEAERLFQIPLISLCPANIFADALESYQLGGATIVAPDRGAVARCEALAAAAGLPPGAIAWFEKHRMDNGIEHGGFYGEAGTQVVIVDDILDTGATIISACLRMLCAGVEDIQIMVTHGLFTGKDWQELWDLGVSRIFRTDTVPGDASADDPRIVTLSVIPLLTNALAEALAG